MTKSQPITLRPEQIDLGWRARSRHGDIPGLAASIRENGQLQRIVVRKIEPRHSRDYELIAGYRRLKACEVIGIDVKAEIVTPEGEAHALAMQLFENLHRLDFDALEEGEGLLRLKNLYEAQHPETKHGATGGRGKVTKTKLASAPVERFSRVAATTLGCSESRVNELIQVASIDEPKKRAIKKAPTAGERNKLVRETVSEIRRDRKVARLNERARIHEKESRDRVESVPVAEARAVLKLGDNAEFFRDADPESFGLILTDPPYGLDWTAIQHETRASLNKGAAWDLLDVGWVVRAERLLAKGGSIVAFCPAEWVGFYKMVCQAIGLEYQQHMVWEKDNPAPKHRTGYQDSDEHMIWASKGSPHFMPPPNAGRDHNVFHGPICGGNERLDHPTQKPEWLIGQLLDRHAAKGMRVLDPFAGVGTTLACCIDREIYCVGVELDDHYVHQARMRLTIKEKGHGEETRVAG